MNTEKPLSVVKESDVCLQIIEIRLMSRLNLSIYVMLLECYFADSENTRGLENILTEFYGLDASWGGYYTTG